MNLSHSADTTLELLRLSLPESGGEHVVYSMKKPLKCSFTSLKSLDGIIYSSKQKVFKRFNFLEKIYFKVKETKLEDKEIKMTLNLASNVIFRFSYEDCLLKKQIIIDGDRYSFEEIKVIYSDALGAPVLDYFIIKHKGHEFKLYQHVLKSHVPIYELKIGPAVSIRTNFRPGNEKTFRDTSPTVQPIPAFIFRYGNLFINKDGAGAAGLVAGGVTALIAAIRDGEPYRNPGVHERRNGIMFGPIVKYKNFQFRYMKNWIDKEKGSELKVTYSHEFRITKNFHLIPRVYLQAWNTKYSDYYLGVDADEKGFSMYQGERAFNYSSMLRALYFDEKIIYLADFGIKFFDKNVYRSPIVNTKIELRATLGVLFRVF